MSNIRNMYDRYVEMKHALCDNCSAQIFLNGPVVAPVTLMNDFLVYRQAMVCQAASLWVCVFFKYHVGDTAEKSPHHKAGFGSKKCGEQSKHTDTYNW